MSKKIDLISGVCGFYKIETILDDVVTSSTGWFKNLITDIGLDRRAGYSDLLARCMVGTGNTTPTFSDVNLANQIASTTSSSTSSVGRSTSSPYYAYITKVYTFAQGSVSGNISEVGVGWGVSNSLFSRSLIRDGEGNPTTITVLSSEILRVTYQLRYYAPLVDVTGVVTINSIDYTWTARAAEVVSSSDWTAADRAESFTFANVNNVYDGYIGSITGAPSGSSNSTIPLSVGSYSNGSFSLNYTLTIGIDKGNFAAGVGAVLFTSGCSRFQIGFSPKIPKTSNDTLSIAFTHGWGRS